MTDNVTAARSETYTYDAVNRLKTASSTMFGSYMLNYDAAGNRVGAQTLGGSPAPTSG